MMMAKANTKKIKNRQLISRGGANPEYKHVQQ